MRFVFGQTLLKTGGFTPFVTHWMYFPGDLFLCFLRGFVLHGLGLPVRTCVGHMVDATERMGWVVSGGLGVK